MRGFQSLFPVVALLIHPSFSYADPRFASIFEDSFAGAIILTDSDALTLGVKDFDPNDWLNINNDNIGSEDALDLRKSIGVSTLPFTFELGKSDVMTQRAVLRFSALRAEGDVVDIPDEPTDLHKETILGVFTGYEQNIEFAKHWSFETGIGFHLQYYISDYDFNSSISQEIIKPLIDGQLVNTSAWAATVQPKAGFVYSAPRDWGHVKYNSTFNYFSGVGWGKANNGDVGTPEGWYWSNEAKFFYDVTDWGRSVQTLYSSIRRVDVGGDTVGPIGAQHYYEGTVGWLMTPPFKIQFVDNIGVGLSVNYGSALKGGSLVLFFNQD
ncbi:MULTISPECIES: Solitary outer membrane autotransporter beta-barrel domain [Vibrio]|uniref:Solitary outer membrane autotransporter beta-barrel domain n=1 Tax=Vibrio TaxID=662 RepID=UPI003D0BBF44